MPDSSLMSYRTIAQMLQISVLPEIERRFKAGQLIKPFHLKLFRFSQKTLADRTVQPIVELNDEVIVTAQVKAKRPIAKGEPIALNDIHPNECYLEPPYADGKPLAYFLFQSAFLNYFTFFDFSPNAPDFVNDGSGFKLQYPVLDLHNAKRLYDAIDPVRQIQLLANANWPPAPGYYPAVLVAAHQNPKEINNPSFVETVAAAYTRDYWDERLSFWEETNFFPNRLSYLRRAIDSFFVGDYISSIYVLVPHFEGIVRDYLKATAGTVLSGFKAPIKKLKQDLIARGIFMFPPEVIETIFEFLEKGSFWMQTDSIISPTDQVNRHGIAHGVFTGFESKGTALKYLVLMDSLGFILLHEKLLTGKI
jgi:hypothetical protein